MSSLKDPQTIGRVTLRHLHVLPARRVRRAEYAPAGRTLHLLDVENLMGGPRAGRMAVHHAIECYRGLAGVGPGDQAIIGVNPALAFDVADGWPGALVAVRPGPNGADLAILTAAQGPTWIAQRFDRVVVGSGDAIFTELARRLCACGVSVVVVACESALSGQLAATAHAVRILEPQAPLREVV